MSTTPSTSENFSSTINNLNSPESSLYTDFSSDSKPQVSDDVKPQEPEGSPEDSDAKQDDQTQVQKDNTNEQTIKKPNRKDWIDTTNPLHCKPCDFIAKDIQDFQDHSLSYKHIKKTAEVLEMKVNSKKDEEKKQPTSFVCQVCMCTCNSESAWNSHLLGQKHRKNLEKQGAERNFLKQKMKHGGGIGSSVGPVYNTQHFHGNKPYQKPPSQGFPSPGVHCANDFAQYKEPLIGLEYVTEIQVAGQNPRYHCKLCDAKFDHNIKFPHLVGAKHRFNVLKEKYPSLAQEIRIGVKKRSELTGKLLEVAVKIEQEEGRKQVKTCVEASPFVTASSSSSALSQGRGRGHPIKGSSPHPLKGCMKKNPNITFQSSNFNNPHPYGGNASNYGRGQARGRGQQRGGMRGRGGGNESFYGRDGGGERGKGRGRGRGNTNSYGRGYNQQNYQQPYNFNSYQQYQPPNQSNQFQPSPLLPQEAFIPRSPPRSQSSHDMPYNYTPPSSHNYGPSQTQPQPWNHPPAERLPPVAAPAQPTTSTEPQTSSTPKSPESTTKQDLLQGLSDLGKLVNSEEDASIALQVSNALTQALLKYRMQNLE